MFVTVGRHESPSPAPITGPTFASAVLSGVGAVCASFPPLSADGGAKDESVLDGEDRSGRVVGAGDADFRMLGLVTFIGGARVWDGAMADLDRVVTVLADVEGTDAAGVDDDDDDDDPDGTSNSGGRTRGVACTLVINFARSQ